MDFYTQTFNKIRILKPNLKDSSIRTYLNTIKKITQKIYDKDTPNDTDFDDFEMIKSKLLSIKNLASRKNTVTAILVFLKSIYKPEKLIISYGEYLKELTKEQDESYLDNVKTEKEEKNWVSRQDILNKINSLKRDFDSFDGKIDKKSIDIYQKIVVLSLYYILPPLRNDYANTIIIDSKDIDEESMDICKNYINLATKRLLLCAYKTQKFYGIKKIDIPEELLSIIKKWVVMKKKYFKNDNDYLLVSINNGTKMSKNLLTRYLNRIFHPKKVSTTLFRKIYLSEKYPVQTTYRDQIHDAMVMGHSLNTQKMIYSKIT